MQQLDIFADSRDVMLRNDVVEALLRRDAQQAATALVRLAGAYPADDAVPAFGVLVRTLENSATTLFTRHPMLADAHRMLEDEVTPAARRVLSASRVDAWLSACWRAVAQRACALPFDAACSEHHAAPMWLKAGDWVAACDAVGRIESWRRIPAPLAWMVEADYRSSGLDETWPLFVELAWLAPARCMALVSRLRDRTLDALRRQFDAEFAGTGEPADFAWFPAWLLTIKPALAERFREAQPSRHLDPERAMSLLCQILSLERQGRQADLVGRRKALRDLHAGLYAAYMKTR